MDYCFPSLHRKECVERSCDYVFAVDSLAMLDHAHTLQKLIEINRLAVFIPVQYDYYTALEVVLLHYPSV